jgi:uncharacterized membrane protein
MAQNPPTPTPDSKATEVTAKPREQDAAYDLELHQGPLPHVQDFAAYNDVLPGAADRILKMAERDQKAVIRMNWANWFTGFISMVLGKGFLYALVAGAVYLAINDKPLEALMAGLAPIVATIYANTRKPGEAEPKTEKDTSSDQE